MSVRNQLRLLLGGLGAGRSARPEARSAMGEFLERSRLVGVLIFIVTVMAIVVISSAGLTTLDAPLLLLSSDASAHLTGATITVDDGQVL